MALNHQIETSIEDTPPKNPFLMHFRRFILLIEIPISVVFNYQDNTKIRLLRPMICP
jgi:hypothetical protein